MLDLIREERDYTPKGTPGFVSLVLAVAKEEYMRHLFHLCAM